MSVVPISWHWAAVTDLEESGDPEFITPLFAHGEVGDMCVVTLAMWMPSGDTPVLRLGEWETGPVFHDQTDQWTALDEGRHGSCYIRSWWREINEEVETNQEIFVVLSGYDAPTEGGVLFMSVLQGAADPSVAYHDGGSSDHLATPPVSPGRAVLHTYFGRTSDPDGDPHRAPNIQQVGSVAEGHIGIIAATWEQNPNWMTAELEDNAADPPLDLYGVGFYMLPDDDRTDYEGSIIWDTSLGGPGGQLPLGPQTIVAQGLFLDPPVEQRAPGSMALANVARGSLADAP